MLGYVFDFWTSTGVGLHFDMILSLTSVRLRVILFFEFEYYSITFLILFIEFDWCWFAFLHEFDWCWVAFLHEFE